MNNMRVTKTHGHQDAMSAVASQRPKTCDLRPATRKRIITALLIFAVVWLILPQTVQAATYYVDIDGVGEDGILGTADDVISSDDNPGTTELPWKTLAKAISTAQAGDTVKLRSGNYGDFNITNYSNTDWITYEADTGHSPVFNKIRIYNTTAKNAYLKFDGIDILQPNPNLDPNDPPWQTTILVDLNYANYFTIKNATIKGWNQYLASGIRIQYSSHITIDRCDISYVDTPITFLTTECTNLNITNNHIHNFSASGVSLFSGTFIENNYIHTGNANISDDFFPPDILYLDPAVYPQGSPPGFQKDEEIWQPSSGQPTAKGRFLTCKWEYTKYVLYLDPITPSGSFVAGVECKSQITEINFTPTQRVYSWKYGSLIVVRTANMIIRKNVLRDFPGQAIKFYGGCTYTNMVIENNLVYDVTNGNSFVYIVGPTVIRNNIFIGHIGLTSLYMMGSGLLNRYIAATGIIGFGTGYDGTGSHFYNNIVVSPYFCPDPTDPSKNEYEEDYNICWLRYGTGQYHSGGKGAHTFIAVWTDASTNNSRGWPNYFEFTGYGQSDPYKGKTGPNVYTYKWDQPYDYDYAVDGVRPFFVSPGFRTNAGKAEQGLNVDAGKVWDYRLAAGSPGINFGATPVATWQEVLSGQVTGPSQPPDSLGSLGSDGFIKDDGSARDVDYHSVGCYEYVSTSFLYGDVNEDGEISAFDAALAAHIAVDLEHAEIKNRAAAEVSDDEEVTAYDAALIAQRAVGLIEKFPVEE